MRPHLTLPAALVAASLSMGVTSAHAAGLVAVYLNSLDKFDAVYAPSDLLHIDIPGPRHCYLKASPVLRFGTAPPPSTCSL